MLPDVQPVTFNMTPFWNVKYVTLSISFCCQLAAVWFLYIFRHLESTLSVYRIHFLP